MVSLIVLYVSGDGQSMNDGVAGPLLLAADMGDEQRVQSSIPRYDVLIVRLLGAVLFSISFTLNIELLLSSGPTGS